MSDHVTGGSIHVTPIGSLRSFITLTDDGKPLPPTAEPEHQLHGFCWCQPLVETDTVTGDHLFIHRRSLDSPHIEEDKAMTETEPVQTPDDTPAEPADDVVNEPPKPTEPEEPKP